MKNKVVYIVIAVVVAVLAAIGIAYYYDNANNYVAKVDNEKVTKAEYKFFLSDVKSSLEQYAGVADADAATKENFWKGSLGNEKAEEIAKKGALENAQDFKIQFIKAKESGIKLQQSDLDSVTTNINNIITAQKGKAAAEKAVKENYGITLSQLKSIYKDITVVNKFSDKQKSKIKYTEEDLKKYYEDNKDSMDSVTVSHILFSTKDENGNALTDAKKAEVKKKAEEVLAKIKAGQDFAALAKENSADTGTKDNGGKITVKKGQTVQAFDEWCFNKARKPGDIEIVETAEYGYHIIKYGSRTTYNDLKSDVKDSYLNKKYSDELQQWKKDKRFNIVKKDSVYNSISVLSI